MKQKLKTIAKAALAASLLSGGAAWAYPGDAAAASPKTILCMAAAHVGNGMATAIKILQAEDGTLSARVDSVNVFHGRILADHVLPILAAPEVKHQYFCGGMHHYRGAGFRLEFYGFGGDEPEESGTLRLTNPDGTTSVTAMEKIADSFEIGNYCE